MSISFQMERHQYYQLRNNKECLDHLETLVQLQLCQHQYDRSHTLLKKFILYHVKLH
jgi:hypothetical protein